MTTSSTGECALAATADPFGALSFTRLLEPLRWLSVGRFRKNLGICNHPSRMSRFLARIWAWSSFLPLMPVGALPAW
jgi:hypothetical protein